MDEERERPAKAPEEEHPLEGGQGEAIDRAQEAEAAEGGHGDAPAGERLEDDRIGA